MRGRYQSELWHAKHGHGENTGTSRIFFLRPAGGRLGPLAERGLVLPVGECHEVLGERARRAQKNFMRRKRQVAKLVRAAVSQEKEDEQRRSAN